MPRPRKTLSTTATTQTSSTTSASSSVRLRKKPPVAVVAEENEGVKNLGNSDGLADDSSMPSWTTRNQWIVFAVASGACAAFNGVFAKLTTNDLSTHIAQGISGFLGLTDLEKVVEVIVRCAFFGLNLLFNGIMWSLFTQALAKGQSTTQVSIMNTSTNFVITAFLGLAIFAESLPPLWWVGAAMLVAGNVIIGRGTTEEGSEAEAEVEGLRDGSSEVGYRDDDDSDEDHEHRHSHDDVSAAERGRGSTATPQEEGILPVEKDDEDEDVPLLGNLS
ncbi:uncharacterized protein GGS22DRAFT_152235 [Annulohypoxylon maeteangense]|uniref:uncharacterized protein n=1 Tax=Annulohypoxylon maeteangense TaxID=1927788 RepID=UPI00200757DA|nr:uncharacterized protein GGS22DRAFT_152235 [Annulohypoxylon maeteangense]KAI0888733.1 hypothetical protein GGS22DRAFT_152235 [Annulohypoxylon maeteangense]